MIEVSDRLLGKSSSPIGTNSPNIAQSQKIAPKVPLPARSASSRTSIPAPPYQRGEVLAQREVRVEQRQREQDLRELVEVLGQEVPLEMVRLAEERPSR